MQYTDILREANLHRGAKIDTVLGKWFINQGMQKLATDFPSARKRNTTTLDVAPNVWVDLPAGCLTVIECTVGGVDYDAYEVSFGQIRTQSATTLTLSVVYLTVFPDVVADSDVPGVPELYHRPLALFIAARDRQRVFADEDTDSVRLMSEFMSAAASANNCLTNAKRTRRILPVAAFK